MRRDLLRQVANVVAFVAVVVVNYLANALPLNNQTTGEVANRFPVFFLPAGFTFAIWGLIYLLLAGFVLYQALPAQAHNQDARRVDGYFVLASAANIGWLFLWHYNLFVLSLLAMLILLGSLIVIYLRLDIGRRAVSRAVKWLIHVPFSVYLAWITVATISNVTVVLFVAGFTGFGIAPQVWAAILLAVAAGITLTVIWTRADIAFTLVILWAFAGIAVRQSAEPVVFWTAIVAAALLAVFLAVVVLGRRRPARR